MMYAVIMYAHIGVYLCGYPIRILFSTSFLIRILFTRSVEKFASLIWGMLA